MGCRARPISTRRDSRPWSGAGLATARRLLERSRALTTDPDLTARIDASLAFITAEQGDLAGGLAVCDGARAGGRTDLLRDHGRAAQPARADPAADGRHVVGHRGVRRRHRDAVGPGRAREGPQQPGRRHTWPVGPDERAAADFSRAVTPAERRRAPDRGGHGRAQPRVSRTCSRATWSPRSLTWTPCAPPLLPLSPVGVAISNQDRAEALMAAGLTRAALVVLDEAARTFGNHRLQQRRGQAELTIAQAALGDRPAAGPDRRRAAARSRFTRTMSPAYRVRAEALALGAEVQARSHPSVPGDQGRRPRPELDCLGDALVGDRRPARLCARRAAPRRPRRGDAAACGRFGSQDRAPLAVRLRDRDVRAALAERTGRPSDALTHVRRGLADLHEWQSSFGSLDLQTMVTGHGRRLAVRGLRVASRSRSPEVLFEWSERARMLASRVQPVRVPHDEQAGRRPRRAAHARGQGGGVAGGRRPRRPSCGSGSANAPGGRAAPGRTTTR